MNLFQEVRVMIPADQRVAAIITDRLGETVDGLHEDAGRDGNAQQRHAADWISEIRRQVQRA